MIVVLTGAPGAGKGTQADLLAQRDGFRKLSTGDSLRRHIREGTRIGIRARDFMDEGRLVPDEILLEILKAELLSASGSDIILDGYPRNSAQADCLQRTVSTGLIRGCIHLDVDTAVLVERISGRRTCIRCGASYHTVNSPSIKAGICDRCGNATIQRPDDTEEKVRVRLEIYDRETRPVLEFYKTLGLYHNVNGTGGTEVVYSRLKELLSGFR